MVMQTHVVDIGFYEATSSHKRDEFRKPTKISFKRMQSPEVEYVPGNVSVPADPDRWTSDVMEDKISITRVPVMPGQGLMARFDDVDSDTLIDVVVAQNRRPHYEDFENAFTISKEVNFYYVPGSKYSEVTFYYIGILPNKKMLERGRLNLRAAEQLNYTDTKTKDEEEDVVVDYKIGVELPQCVSWVAAGRMWDDQTHCKVVT